MVINFEYLEKPFTVVSLSRHEPTCFGIYVRVFVCVCVCVCVYVRIYLYRSLSRALILRKKKKNLRCPRMWWFAGFPIAGAYK